MSANKLDQAQELQDRTKQFAIRVIRMFKALPKTEEARILGRQLLRSATPVAANYRAACRGRSKAEFTAKLGVAVEEMDETLFWLELFTDSGILPGERTESIMDEAKELLAILAASRQTARKKR